MSKVLMLTDRNGGLAAPRWTPTAIVPTGFRYVPELLTASEHDALVRAIATLDFEPVVMRGVRARRTVAHFGWDYGYTSARLVPAAPIPMFLWPLRVKAAALAGVPSAKFEQVLIARYPERATIGWHREAPSFGPVVVGFSLGAPAALRFRRTIAGTRHVFRQPLATRSGYVLSGDARTAWQHSLAPAGALRWSITFRTIRRDHPRVRT
jgi:alkylated DNA repair dioxygenase AlkB